MVPVVDSSSAAARCCSGRSRSTGWRPWCSACRGTFWLTFVCLAATGAADTVSMVIRNIVRQLETPDRLRGRMIGVNMVFFMGGPQLGELEAGLVANWLGAVISVVSGGLGCLAATFGIAAVTPALRAYRRQDPPAVPEEEDRSKGHAGEPG